KIFGNWSNILKLRAYTIRIVRKRIFDNSVSDGRVHRGERGELAHGERDRAAVGRIATAARSSRGSFAVLQELHPIRAGGEKAPMGGGIEQKETKETKGRERFLLFLLFLLRSRAAGRRDSARSWCRMPFGVAQSVPPQRNTKNQMNQIS